MNEVTNSVTYEGNNRVESLTRTSTKADDCATLGNKYIQLGAYYRRLDTAATDEAREAINSEIERIKREITEYAGYISGYPEDGAE